MRTVYLTLIVLLTFSAYAQSSENGPAAVEINTGKTINGNMVKGFTNPDALWLRNGHVILIKDGTIYLPDADITLANGMIVLPNGTIGRTDCTVLVMQEGEHLDFRASNDNK